MPTNYIYDLWDGKKVIGQFNAGCELHGLYLAVPMVSTFKLPYGRKFKTIELPITYLIKQVSYNLFETHIVLDVRRKSKSQRAFLIGGSRVI